MNTFGSEQAQDPPPATLREHKTLTPPIEGDTLAAVDVGAFGELLCLWAAPDSADSGRIRAAVHTATRVRTTTLQGVSLPLRAAQPLPDGGLLLVATRSTPTSTGAHHNAAVYDAHGSLVRTGDLGDGIARLAVTPAEHVWVTYRDNDIGGNAARRPAGGADPIVTFDTRFAVTRTLPGPVSAHSLNLDGETAWLSHAAGSPIVRIDSRITSWTNSVATPCNLLVHGDRLALVGGPGAHRTLVTTGELDGDEFDPTHSYRLAMPDGDEPPGDAWVSSRGPHLHAVAGNVWYRLELSRLERSARPRRRR